MPKFNLPGVWRAKVCFSAGVCGVVLRGSFVLRRLFGDGVDMSMSMGADAWDIVTSDAKRGPGRWAAIDEVIGTMFIPKLAFAGRLKAFVGEPIGTVCAMGRNPAGRPAATVGLWAGVLDQDGHLLTGDMATGEAAAVAPVGVTGISK
eukprot:gb/GFBE01071547.1/.p1 GENE.gb/GFBE01071547.1/~~gb/GFBE01071547.1/.p1  ORF type:complete len:148 (+),score=22.16 gb/GFBE01071547.1/:1-444(+)